MIEATGLRKEYGRETVLDGADLTVEPGECVLLTGDNGTGKTTLLHLLMGLRHPDAGEVRWGGETLTGARPDAWKRAREAWGFLPQKLRLPPEAAVRDLVRFHARIRDIGPEPARAWLDRVGLEHTGRMRVDELSGGMQQRLGIALTLFHGPDLVVMDEPAGSLDPDWREALVGWISGIVEGGTGVLVTTQIAEWLPIPARRLRCEAGSVVDEGEGGSVVGDEGTTGGSA